MLESIGDHAQDAERLHAGTGRGIGAEDDARFNSPPSRACAG